MPSFRANIKAQKVAWVKRLLDNKSCKWNVLSEALMGFPRKDLECKNTIESHRQITNKFYSQMLEFWYQLHSVPPTQESIEKEILWNNKFIIIDNKPINLRYTQWQKHAIRTLGDIVDINGNLLTREIIQEKYNVTIKQMEYNSLIDAIPATWRAMLKNVNNAFSSLQIKSNNSNLMTIGNTCYNIDMLSNKKVYNMFISSILKTPTSLPK